MIAPFSIGIDLGTSNSALAFIRNAADEGTEVLPIPQPVSSGATAALPILPSVLLREDGSWIIGRRALDEASRLPERVVASSKSWLSYRAVDQESRFLPFRSSEVPESEKISPVEAATILLERFRDAWNDAFGELGEDYRFDRQLVTITVPASFDEVAQALTLSAARAAGYPSTTRLLEEPQAAFYRYLERAGELDDDATVLVIDIGGGTTDFSLFTVTPKDGAVPEVRRIEVSPHILVGGDNIDVAVLNLLVGEASLTISQKRLLVQQARAMKEAVLGSPDQSDVVHHAGLVDSGAGLFGKAQSFEASASSIRSMILEGFFPIVSAGEKTRRTVAGVREWVLPYPDDSRVTAHLAQFLQGRKVDAVLMNGGTLTSVLLRERLLSVIEAWQGNVPRVLENCEYDLAVARGAAWYGQQIVRGRTDRIAGGYPRAIFLELLKDDRRDSLQGVCIVPRGLLAGESSVVPGSGYEVLIDRRVRFQLWTSRNHGALLGERVDLAEGEFEKLPPITTILRLPPQRARPMDGRIRVRPLVTLAETGIVTFECEESVPAVDGTCHRWRLDFNLREDEPEQETIELPPPAVLQSAREAIDRYFGKAKGALTQGNPKHLVRELETALKTPREKWNIGVLRVLCDTALKGIGRRSRSADHESAWLYLVGWSLRPGCGAAGDDDRIGQVYASLQSGPAFPKERSSREGLSILWRRIAGGLDSSRQRTIWEKVWNELVSARDPQAESVRLLGALERVDASKKIAFAEYLLARPLDPAAVWALGRLVARRPFFGGPECTLAPQIVAPWAERILADIDQVKRAKRALIAMAAPADDPSVRLSDELVLRIGRRLKGIGVSREEFDQSREILLSRETNGQEFWLGDALPSGIRMI
jgi:molecular chaperone DnaK (HSP70)